MAEQGTLLGVGEVLDLPDIPGSKFADLDRYAVAIPAENAYAVCVPYTQARAAPVDGDKVYVRRTRTIDCLHEDTLRIVRLKGKKVRLECQEPMPVGYEGKVVTYPSSSAPRRSRSGASSSAGTSQWQFARGGHDREGDHEAFGRTTTECRHDDMNASGG